MSIVPKPFFKGYVNCQLLKGVIILVIDFHTHIFPDSVAEKTVNFLGNECGLKPSFNGTLVGLKQSMAEAGIDKSVIHIVITKPEQTKRVNEWAASVQDDNIISFGGLHPLNEDYKEHVNAAVSLGLKGIKFHPDYHNCFVDEPFMLPVYDYILSKGLIVLFHAGVDIGLPPPVHCPPDRLRKVIDAMKGGVIVAAHLGGFRMWDKVETYLVGQNLYFDTSMGFEHYSKEQFLRIVKNHGCERIVFGTDAPWSNQKEELIRIKSSGFNENVLENILYNNAKNILMI